MPYRPGDRVGPYEILALIGAGGMGEVFKARDTRLDRIVALKTSKSQFNERFTREARTIAALNHPNIATLFDVGPDYLVMEFVDGEPVRGPLPHDEALKVALQIAEAIEAAHDKAIIHRDLKPGNILRREDGSIKVLDFGLAKALETESTTTQAPGADSPTLTLEATRAGMILGTAAYMSPEQAKAKRADRRADIFSYGVVLYELLTGERLFNGESTGDILASVIKENPPLDKVPEQWRPLIARCIEKDPKQRLQAIGEARLLLERGLPMPEKLAPAPSQSRFSIGTLVASGVAVLALAGAGWMYLEPAAEQPQRIVRFDIDAKGPNTNLALSPDGQTLVWFAQQKLWLRRMDSQGIEEIPGAERATYPFWSPDSKNIAFFQQGELKRMAAGGGPAITIAPAVDGRGGSWNQDNVIIFAPGPGSGIFKVPAGGGTPQVVLKSAGPEDTIRFPFFLPDGQHFLVNRTTATTHGIFIASLQGGDLTQLRPEDSSAIYASGFLLFSFDRTLMAQPFDAQALKTSGDPFPLSDSVGGSTVTGYASMTASLDGTLVHSLSSVGSSQLRWFDRKGAPLTTLGDPRDAVQGIAISPDATQVAQFAGSPDQSVLFLQPSAGGPASPIAGERGLPARSPAWSPEGRKIAYALLQGGRSEIFVRSLEGDAKVESLGVSGLNNQPFDWSRDGKWLAYRRDTPETGQDIMLLPLTGDRKPVTFLATPAIEGQARFSPDGHWMAFVQQDQGQSAVFVQAISAEGHATGVKYRISSGNGNAPHWRADGKELLYVGGRKFMAVPVTGTATSFQHGAETELFTLPEGISVFDAAPDHQRFLLAVPVGERRQSQSLNVILNWPQLAKK